MSTIRNPVGPQPRNVYWRRRLLVLVGIVAVIVVIILIVVRPGGGKPAAVPTNTTSHTAVANVVACNPANVKVVGITDAVTYAAGVDPMISLSITNTGTAACSFSDGSDKQVYVITSGTEKIWSSKDCQSKPEAATTTLQPGVAVKSTPFAWSRTRSNPAACSATNPPQVIAGGASYHLTVTVNGVTSAKTDSPQFILK
ncbi:MAG TPA: hypothetical protein VGF80_11555 [Galbitalea sp.]|jgi:hypothetical protein